MGYNDSTTYTPDTGEVSEHGLEARRSVTIASGIGTLAKYTVLGQYTSGVNSGTFGSYSNTGATGLDTAVGILADKSDASASGINTFMYTHGIFYQEKMIGLDSNAVSDLNNCEFVAYNV